MDPNEKIAELYKKYESNEYMLNRLNTHLFTILPNTLEMENENYAERILRTNALQTMQETFIKVFLDKHKYYYIASSGYYYEYIDDTYIIRKEDDIHYKLLSTISEDRTLMDWKYKTKSSILRRIKERHLLTSTPNTATIQHILNALHPTIFPSKNATKYFLTIIGDNILKKQTPIKVINKNAHIFAEMDRMAPYIGVNNLTSNFTSKYNDNHTYSQYRLLIVNDQISIKVWINLINHLGLDLLCVAAHYSNRYGSSEHFLDSLDIKSHVMYLQINSQETIVSRFIEHSTQPANDSFQITWKQIHYIWKQYLTYQNIPNMIYSNSLKQMLKQKLTYEESADAFTNITSKYLPNISHFLQFWEENIIESDSNELEISELYVLYGSSNLKETDISKLIQHFFPETKIVENKYILNVECKLWNKQTGIISLLDTYKNNPSLDIVSIDDLYTEYTNKTKGRLIVSKQYFETYIKRTLSNVIVYDTFIDFQQMNVLLFKV